MIWLVAAGCRGFHPPATTETATTHTGSPMPVPTAETADPCGPPGLIVGDGEQVHDPIADGESAVMVHGIQGGWHLEVSGEVSGLGPIVAVHATVTRMSDGLVLAGNQQPKNYELTPPEDCGGTFAGLQALIDDHQPPVPYQQFICTLVGERLLIEVDVSDLDTPDRVAIDSVEVVAAPWMYDPC